MRRISRYLGSHNPDATCLRVSSDEAVDGTNRTRLCPCKVETAAQTHAKHPVQAGAGRQGRVSADEHLHVSICFGNGPGVRTFCSSAVPASCISYLKIGVTEYSGDSQVHVYRSEFSLVDTAGVRYAPATARQATRVVRPNDLLSNTVLLPDDDGDYVSGTLVFLVPYTAGRRNLMWQGARVATFVTPVHGKLYETR